MYHILLLCSHTIPASCSFHLFDKYPVLKTLELKIRPCCYPMLDSFYGLKFKFSMTPPHPHTSTPLQPPHSAAAPLSCPLTAQSSPTVLAPSACISSLLLYLPCPHTLFSICISFRPRFKDGFPKLTVCLPNLNKLGVPTACFPYALHFVLPVFTKFVLFIIYLLHLHSG